MGEILLGAPADIAESTSSAILDGMGNDLGDGGFVAVISALLVFAILAVIILITGCVGKLIEKNTHAEAVADVSADTPAEAVAGQKLDPNDEDAVVAALVASIDYRNETKKDIKVISVKEIH